ncbi:MAG: type III toxin-antitoxin system TenpIN family toxin [Terracidiphilus sp.]|jgi:protein AbiQ
MLIHKLEEVFYKENSHLVEVLDKAPSTNTWAAGKERGYGIVICEHNGLRFGIPLRSRLHERASGYRTVDDKGLDYGKAVLLTKGAYVSSIPFKIPSNEYKILQSKEFIIIQQFSKYIERYIKAHKKPDQNILRKYRFSTLQNYHSELGIPVPESSVLAER